MIVPAFGIFAIIAYASVLILHMMYGNHTSPTIKFFSYFLIMIGLITHAMQLHHLIDTSQGQNLSWLNLISLLTWLSGLLIMLASFSLPILSLNFLLYPVAILFLGLNYFLHPVYFIVTKNQPQMLVHILSATAVVAFLIIAAIQSVLLFFQQLILKQKKLLAVLNFLPPLETMKRLLFLEINLNFIVLSIFFLLTLYLVKPIVLLHYWAASLLSVFLWIIFLFLVFIRYFFRWRPATGALSVIVALCIGLLIYLTSHLR